MNIFKKILFLIIGEPSVAKAVKNIDKAIAKLEQAVEHNAAKKEAAILAQALAAKVEAAARDGEEHAKRVAEKMKELLS